MLNMGKKKDLTAEKTENAIDWKNVAAGNDKGALSRSSNTIEAYWTFN